MLRSFLLMIFLVAGCSFRVEAPELPLNDSYLKAGRGVFEFHDRWWQGFKSSTLNELAEGTLLNNNQLKSALMRREAARKQLAFTKADLWPSTQLRSSSERSEISAIRIPGIPDRSLEVYDAGVSASWEIDLWGAFRSRVEVQRQNLSLSEAEIRGLQMSLAADTVRAFVAKCTAERRIELVRQAAVSARTGVAVLSEQYRTGLAGDFELREAEADLKILQSTLPELRSARDSAVVALAVLRGVAPSFEEAIDCPQGGVVYQESVGLDKPEELLRRRPDIISAEARLRGAVANVGDQVAQLFPKLNLTGSLAFEGATFDGLLDDPTKVFSYGPFLTWRPFSSLTLVQRADTAKALADSVRFDYQSIVLKAVGEVESSMGAYRANRRRFGVLLKAAHAARRSLRIAELRYKVGAIDALEFSKVERSAINVEIQALLAAEQLNYRLADLALALGV